MSDVVAFVRARLDADRADADAMAVVRFGGHHGTWVRLGGRKRALREAEVKRRIVDEMAPDLLYDNGGPSTARWTLGVLASVWATHPDFDPNWDREGAG